VLADHGSVPVIRLTVNRSSLLGEAYGHLAQAGPAIKARLEVTYLNAQGLQEAGLDYGGLMKDFIEDVRLPTPALSDFFCYLLRFVFLKDRKRRTF
jgi:hypothetical protein